MGDVWGIGLTVALDAGECALVREKAALLLERLTALGSKTDCSGMVLNFPYTKCV